jgi:hypothetical protein
MSHINTFLLVPTSCFTANQITDKKKPDFTANENNNRKRAGYGE